MSLISAGKEYPVGLSIVVPVYRGAATVGALVEALSALTPEGGIEIVLVNDGSPDNSGDVCRALQQSATVPLTYIEHARNFGEHNAVMTGLRHARGAYIITMDDDLQNPPEEVIRLYDHARLGNFDVVYTRYAVKEHEGWRNLGSAFANWVADQLMDKPKGLYLSSFRCMSALAVSEVVKYRGPYPYIDGLLMQVTQRLDSIEVKHFARAMMIYWLALAAAISTSLIGQILLKSGAANSVAAEGGFFDQLFRLPTMVGLVCYGGAALLYIIALRRIPMSVALPCTAASYIVIAIIGWAIFGESLGLQKIAAITLIAAGVALLATTA
jgi:glycosyltransferase involved in cell wall biosynthesis